MIETRFTVIIVIVLTVIRTTVFIFGNDLDVYEGMAALVEVGHMCFKQMTASHIFIRIIIIWRMFELEINLLLLIWVKATAAYVLNCRSHAQE